MNLLKGRWFVGASMVLMACMANTSVQAQSAVAGVHSLIVPYPAGNAFDIVARRIQGELGEKLGTTIVVENVSGASGSMAATRVLNTPSKNLILLAASPNELTLPPLIITSAHYKPDDFRMIAQMTSGAFALITRPDYPADSIDAFIRDARKPGHKPITYGSTGVGSIFHMVGADFGKRLGIPVSHIPYRGGAPIIQDLMGSQVDMTFLPVTPSTLQMERAGKLKILTILAERPNPMLPKVPTIDVVPELKGMHYALWTGLFVPASTPQVVAEKINAATSEIVASKDFREWVAERGNDAGQVMNLQEAAAFYTAESTRFTDLARRINLSGK
ncbi:Bug family tripartite tricarboxylate transporter substrate binding protein [Advenella mimigardefordensis]|uniref:Putative Bug-like extracytoplasmic solute binding receptor, TTT family n=1 Tax=Advenella mimigardefordensis (strain DSM 17166 / LMG 22922 / DPN7) TaxID=1247726 RepID=W0PI08_ADVMD|nr:tripartite tricarboxylate transporter substrate binding protein [Advenella mimigardefordensis]AHG64568.1 putative Bug-like extracytoplasmic solute binding receptor, TTT family [Advenella mimigardefordensis DPN7]